MSFAVNRSLTTPRQIHFFRDLVLDKSTIESLIYRAAFSIYSWGAILDSLFSFSLNRKHFSLALNTLLSLKSLYPLLFQPRSSLNLLVSVLNLVIFMHSCILDLGFGFFETFWGFWDFCEIFGLGCVVLVMYAHALHSHCIITMFHAF